MDDVQTQMTKYFSLLRKNYLLEEFIEFIAGMVKKKDDDLPFN